ncbi:hypothetical protein CWE09_10770 [Aliidiomarina minuta]|uniref:Lipocalin-like domain-containing protein n=1 Tax=Aliidiomarina minuta TaxID=880057 RepID=A0A432W4G9_9GAMM|nr:hypothetical protein [Aliidiomarina minuta]RUO24350.1 hypothetical protein CWE09_10770 [Aliidiomarina minuta]
MRYLVLLVSFWALSGCAQSSDWYEGRWQVTDAKFPGVSAMGMEEAQVWFGSEVRYSKDEVSFRDEVCAEPSFSLSRLNEGEFYTHYRAGFQSLKIAGDSVEILNVSCPSEWTVPGATLIKASDETAYVPWDGVFFKVTKIAD